MHSAHAAAHKPQNLCFLHLMLLVPLMELINRNWDTAAYAFGVSGSYFYHRHDPMGGGS
jgi:hypothetical protein